MDMNKRLAYQINTSEDIKALSSEELILANERHCIEIIKIRNDIDSRPSTEWTVRAKKSLRILILHNQWIEKELKNRKRKDHENNAEKLRSTAQNAKLKRIEASTNNQEMEAKEFKNVVREVVGKEMYEYIWLLVRQKSAEKMDAK